MQDPFADITDYLAATIWSYITSLRSSELKNAAPPTLLRSSPQFQGGLFKSNENTTASLAGYAGKFRELGFNSGAFMGRIYDFRKGSRQELELFRIQN
ncbi:hypothetical protein N7523_008674 [Penicillium sp. IBT 18751x]|nr:hypothetical protein N7523_008674 [Penicillium sp. IBT 18751x]